MTGDSGAKGNRFNNRAAMTANADTMQKRNREMAADFRILVHRQGESLHLKLLGEFDSLSAHQLIHSIEKNSLGVGRVFIHTSGLRYVDEWAGDFFRKHFPRHDDRKVEVIFTGEAGMEMAPEGARQVMPLGHPVHF